MKCVICGSEKLVTRRVLWPQLIADWQLGPSEVDYVNAQQGTSCVGCSSNLRSMALADALLAYLGTDSLLLEAVVTPRFAELSILELNEAGTLSQFLRQSPKHVFGAYPEVDMHALPYADDSFDLVVHSDTLEHVPNPVHALTECRRVLKPGSALCFTVPTIVGRLSRDRTGLSKSYHGDENSRRDDYVVHTEFGADVWTYVLDAGFRSVEMRSMQYPAAFAMLARK